MRRATLRPAAPVPPPPRSSPSVLYITKPRATLPTNERPLPKRIDPRIQNGILKTTYINASVTSTLTRPLSLSPNNPPEPNPPGVKNTRTPVIRARDCTTWMASTPPKAFHHQRAMPSVCGKAWQINAKGAETIRMIVKATRTTKVSSKATRTPMATSHIKTRKMLPLSELKELSTKSRRAGPAVSALAPPPMAAWESALARSTALPARNSDSAAARNPRESVAPFP